MHLPIGYRPLRPSHGSQAFLWRGQIAAQRKLPKPGGEAGEIVWSWSFANDWFFKYRCNYVCILKICIMLYTSYVHLHICTVCLTLAIPRCFANAVKVLSTKNMSFFRSWWDTFPQRKRELPSRRISKMIFTWCWHLFSARCLFFCQKLILASNSRKRLADWL